MIFWDHQSSNKSFRPGDLARIEANVTSATSTKKPKASTSGADTKASQAEGVVYKVCFTAACQLHHLTLGFQVSDTRIVIAVDSSEPSSEDLDLPERCRVLKLANSITYDRLVFSIF